VIDILYREEGGSREARTRAREGGEGLRGAGKGSCLGGEVRKRAIHGKVLEASRCGIIFKGVFKTKLVYANTSNSSL